MDDYQTEVIRFKKVRIFITSIAICIIIGILWTGTYFLIDMLTTKGIIGGEGSGFLAFCALATTACQGCAWYSINDI